MVHGWGGGGYPAKEAASEAGWRKNEASDEVGVELTKESDGIIVTGGAIRDEVGGLNDGTDPHSGIDLGLTLFNEDMYYFNEMQ